MANDWSREEVEAAVTDYFDMLAKDLRGEPYSKAEHNRRLQLLLASRSRGSVEWKHQNISAVLVELGYPYISGYKPRFNYQDLLRIVVEDRLNTAAQLNQAAEAAVEQPVIAAPDVADILSVLVAPPKRDEDPPLFREKQRTVTKPVRRNYLEIESRNRSLGAAGEEFVMRFEHERLWRAGKRTLADRIEHVALSKGDHLGYDILSFEENGRERLIEVKTTRFGSLTPFFASRNEVEVSLAHEPEYQLYRLYHFTSETKLFTLKGSLGQTCTLEPHQFVALPK